MPSTSPDEVIQEDKATGVRQFKFLRVRFFANIVLADRDQIAPRQTQAPCWRRCRSGR